VQGQIGLAEVGVDREPAFDVLDQRVETRVR
jgi:hypothetical protein